MTSAATLVVGCSEQRPNELRAYHLMGTASDGVILLSRHGATYSAAASEICDYPALLERMLGVVLPSFPARHREQARRALIRRWNRDWGVEAERSPRQAQPRNDKGAGFATEPPESDRAAWTSAHGRHPHAHQDDPDGGDNRERARRRRHID
jgi:hypothetical protein